MERVTIAWSRIATPATPEKDRITVDWIFDNMIDAAKFFAHVEGMARKIRDLTSRVDSGRNEDKDA